jgi:hypothetical protein
MTLPLWGTAKPLHGCDVLPPPNPPTPNSGAGSKGRVGGKSNRRTAVAKRFQDMTRFLLEFHADLTPTERSVWLSVYVFSTNGRATVTQTTLAKIGNVTPRAVRTAVRGLEGKGLLRVLEKGRPGRSSVYRYGLN